MADQSFLSSPTKLTSSFFSTPRLFTGLTSKGFSEADVVMSPTSILEAKLLFGIRNPFWSESNSPRTPEPETRRPWDNPDPKGIGLAIVDDIKDDDESDPKPSKPETRMVIFGSQLKIQIPPLLSQSESPKSPADFNIKPNNSQLGSFNSELSDSQSKNSPFESANSGFENLGSTRVFTSCLSVSEMEHSEDYTCVISYGPNPKTTHIFDNCIVERTDGVPEFSPGRKVCGSSYLSESFLSVCDKCKKNLGQGKDIFMYRGEKAFCSRECRYQEMMLEEGVDKVGADDSASGNCS